MTNLVVRTLGVCGMALAWAAWASTTWAAEKHALLGTWSVDVTGIQQPDPPKSVTITLEDAGADQYTMTVVIEAPDGSKSRAHATFKPDGTAARGEGSLDVDVVSMTMPSRRILVMGAGMAGNPSSTRVFSLADDGKHMIETIIRHLADGTPYTRTHTWARVP